MHESIIAAVLLQPDVRGHWGTRCQHGHTESWPSRTVARIALHAPADWCLQCAASNARTARTCPVAHPQAHQGALTA